MKVITPEGYTFVTKFQEDNSHKVLRSVDFFSIKFDEIFFDTVCWVAILKHDLSDLSVNVGGIVINPGNNGEEYFNQVCGSLLNFKKSSCIFQEV